MHTFSIFDRSCDFIYYDYERELRQADSLLLTMYIMQWIFESSSVEKKKKNNSQQFVIRVFVRSKL